jgi:hypothetical protein
MRRRRVLPHVDHIFDTVIKVPLARFQGGAACASQTVSK